MARVRRTMRDAHALTAYRFAARAPPADASTNDELEQVVSAYAVLGDRARRAAYDQRTTAHDQRTTAYGQSFAAHGQRPAGRRRTGSTAIPVAVRSSHSAPAQPPIVVGPVRWHHGPGRTT